MKNDKPHNGKTLNLPSTYTKALRQRLDKKSIVLIGIMGAGKSSIGKKLADATHLPFVDSDDEVEAAAHMSISDIFELYGEEEFRSGEARVIARLLEEGPQIMATGGGAFMNEDTRHLMRKNAITIWLNSDISVLVDRVSRKSHRPLLKNTNIRKTLEQLLAKRKPIYQQADLTIMSDHSPHEKVIANIIEALSEKLNILMPLNTITEGQRYG